MHSAMLQKKVLNSVILAMLMRLSFIAHANRDSTRIGISVEIKAKQACTYSYVTEISVNLSNPKHTRFSNCDISAVKLQELANQIVNAKFRTTPSQRDDNRLRVFMTVQ